MADDLKPLPPTASPRQDAAPDDRAADASVLADVPGRDVPTPRSDAVWRQPWALASMWVLIVALLVGGSIFVFKSCMDAPAKVIGSAGHALATVAAAFKQGTIATSFVSYATTVSNTLFLQVATLRQMEIFTRTQHTATAFGYVPLPDVVVEARAPVDYTYFLDLNGEWRFVVEDSRVLVFAPPIRFNQPAVDPSAITYEVRKGYFKADEATESLKRSINSLVNLRAQQNIDLVRGNARQQVADFVERWLARSYADGKTFAVRVYFADEKRPKPIPIDPPPLR